MSEPCEVEGCARMKGHEGVHVPELATEESGLLSARRPPHMSPKTDRPYFCRHSDRPETCPVCNPLDPTVVPHLCRCGTPAHPHAPEAWCP